MQKITKKNKKIILWAIFGNFCIRKEGKARKGRERGKREREKRKSEERDGRKRWKRGKRGKRGKREREEKEEKLRGQAEFTTQEKKGPHRGPRFSLWI